MAERGKLIAFEGVDGSGKSTQAKRLHTWLREKGIENVLSFEPTDRTFGRKIRDGLGEGRRYSPAEELELFRKDRKEHVEILIQPSLQVGRWVLLDRYFYSSMAYQGSRGYKTPDEIHAMMTTFAPSADLCLIYEIDVDEAIRRIETSRGDILNPMEQREGLVQVKRIFDTMKYPEIRRIDASGDADTVFARTLEVVGELL